MQDRKPLACNRCGCTYVVWRRSFETGKYYLAKSADARYFGEGRFTRHDCAGHDAHSSERKENA